MRFFFTCFFDNHNMHIHAGTYTYLTLPGISCYFLGNYFNVIFSGTSIDQIKAGAVDVDFLDVTVATMLRTKFSLGLFESMSLSLGS